MKNLEHSIVIRSVEGYPDQIEVAYGDKRTGPLTFDEALGLISVLLIEACRPPIRHWLKTDAEHAAWRNAAMAACVERHTAEIAEGDQA